MKTIGIEAFLTWAFTRELCKGGAGGISSGGERWSQVWRSLHEMAELGAMIDHSPNGFGAIPDMTSDEPPCPDAVAAGEAVQALARGCFTVPEVSLFPDVDDAHGLLAEEEGRIKGELRLRGDDANARHVTALVITAAVLERGPEAGVWQPKYRMAQKNGKPAWFVERRAKDAFGNVYTYEDDGYDARKSKPKPRAYRKWEMVEPARMAIMERIDYIWWREALGRVSESLVGRLVNHRLSDIVVSDSVKMEPNIFVRC